MQRTLTEAEQSKKAFFQLVANKVPEVGGPLLYRFEIEFHQKMQNPQNGIIEFINIYKELPGNRSSLYRGLLHNGNLNYIADYFDSKGKHLFDVEVEKLVISHVQLSGYNNSIMDQMPDGVQYIANLIAKNPS